ncbi:MAG: type I-E CRISPR-associated protein Cse2/CasB, partial [Clostridiales Family XIII bacterium]|nr:type I-E CRISPR-associated protein Cse2/CasB [Clostridiales Family XIII bacterium]
ENEQGILRRFNALVTAKTADEINLHARGVIQLLKQGEIKLDYVRFAKDLYNLQFSSESAKHVQRRWGRDFYHVDNKSKSESESKNKGGSDA